MLKALTVRQRVVLLFTAIGVLAGVISGFIPNGWLDFLLMLGLFYVTYKQTYQILKIQPSEISRSTILKTGFFPTFVCWPVVWRWTYTLLAA